MYDYMKTILSSIKVWVDKQFKQSVSDWNQNDKSALNYIKNKPFGENADGTIKQLPNKYIENLVGENVTNKVFNVDGEAIVASEGAEIFNDYKLNIATGFYSHAEGYNTKASRNYSHTEGYETKAEGDQSHAEGYSTVAAGRTSHAEGTRTTASAPHSHAEGFHSTASGESSHAEGFETMAVGNYSHTEGYKTKAEGDQSHAEGVMTVAAGRTSHAEGTSTTASAPQSHAEGFHSTASGESSHAEGFETMAVGNYSHTEGYKTKAKGGQSHAEGVMTVASGNFSHAEGNTTTASGLASHTEGQGTKASGNQSHAEGQDTKAEGDQSHAEGYSTTANGENQHVQGRFNITDETSAHIVGNGNFDERSNAHTLDWSGNAWFAGDIYIGSTSGKNKDEGSKKLATEEYVDSKVVQSDWHQNDESAPDYVKNRFGGYYENVYSTVFEETTLEFEPYASGNGYYTFIDDYNVAEKLFGSKPTVKVTFDGVIYEKAFDKYSGFYSDETIPFGFYVQIADGAHLEINTTLEGDTHTVKIEKVEKLPVTISEEFLPDSVKVQPDWNQNDETAPDYVKNRTHWVESEAHWTPIDSTDIAFIGETITVSGMNGISQFSGMYQLSNCNKYRVTVNGVEYVVEAYYETNNGYYMLYPGSLSIQLSESEVYMHRIDSKISSDMSIKIEAYMDAVYHPLDIKFLPNTVATIADIEAAIGAAIGGSY